MRKKISRSAEIKKREGLRISRFYFAMVGMLVGTIFLDNKKGFKIVS